ncbi:MAG: hypothetical protein O7B35_01520 [Deltaproteobacteria bacterium]|nr:hypothetical protein [Deltaproteobacteria bacterium]
MSWSVNKSGAKIHKGWDPKGKDKAAQGNWNDFMKRVNSGKHPADAGKSMKYKILKKSSGQAQISLSGGERASFIVDEGKEEINKIQLGGHT